MNTKQTKKKQKQNKTHHLQEVLAVSLSGSHYLYTISLIGQIHYTTLFSTNRNILCLIQG